MRRIRNDTYFSLAALNAAILERLESLIQKSIRDLPIAGRNYIGREQL